MSHEGYQWVVQERHNSIANTLQLCLFCTTQLVCAPNIKACVMYASQCIVDHSKRIHIYIYIYVYLYITTSWTVIPFPSVDVDLALVLLNILILLPLEVLLIFINLYFPDPLSCKQLFPAAHVLTVSLLGGSFLWFLLHQNPNGANISQSSLILQNCYIWWY